MFWCLILASIVQLDQVRETQLGLNLSKHANEINIYILVYASNKLL